MTDLAIAIAAWLATVYLMVAVIVFIDELRRAEEIDVGAIAKALVTALTWIFIAI